MTLCGVIAVLTSALALPALAQTTPAKCDTMATAMTNAAVAMRAIVDTTGDADATGAIAQFDGNARIALERVEASRKELMPFLEAYASALESAAAAMRTCGSDGL